MPQESSWCVSGDAVVVAEAVALPLGNCCLFSPSLYSQAVPHWVTCSARICCTQIWYQMPCVLFGCKAWDPGRVSVLFLKAHQAVGFFCFFVCLSFPLNHFAPVMSFYKLAWHCSLSPSHFVSIYPRPTVTALNFFFYYYPEYFSLITLQAQIWSRE